MKKKHFNPMELKRRQRAAAHKKLMTGRAASANVTASASGQVGPAGVDELINSGGPATMSTSRVRKRRQPNNIQSSNKKSVVFPGTSFTPGTSTNSNTGSFFDRVLAGAHTETDAKPGMLGALLGNAKPRRQSRKSLSDLVVVRSTKSEILDGGDTTEPKSLISIDEELSMDNFMSKMSNVTALRANSTNTRTMLTGAVSASASNCATSGNGVGWKTVNGITKLPMDYTFKVAARLVLPQSPHGDLDSRYHDEIHKNECNIERAGSVHRQIRASVLSGGATVCDQRSFCSSSCRETTIQFTYPSHQLPDALIKEIGSISMPKSALEQQRLHSDYGYGGRSTSTGTDSGSNRDQNVSVDESSINHATSLATRAVNAAFTATTSESLAHPAVATTAFVFRQRCDWGRAFMSLYHLLRERKCSHFYYFEDDLAVLFIAPGTLDDPVDSSGNMPVCALISHSSRGLRRQLARRRVQFDTPLDPSLKERDTASNIELIDELKRFEDDASRANLTTKLKRSGSYQDESLSKSSLLSFVDHASVHGLYTFLLNRVVHRNGNSKFPKLVSSVPFENATCKFAEVSQPIAGAQAHSAGRVQQQSMLRIKGAMLPSSVSALAALMDSQTDTPQMGYSAKFQPHELTVDFNEAVHAVKKNLMKQFGELYGDVSALKTDQTTLQHGSLEELTSDGDGQFHFRVR